MVLTVSVAVVGAGAAGLSAIKLLTCDDDDAVDGGGGRDVHTGARATPAAATSSSCFRVTAFEQSSDIGGQWRYTDSVGADQDGMPVHSSMYKSLRTNLPKECMKYPDYPFPDHLPSFPTHQAVLEYLEDYATHFQLHKHIQFQTVVNNIKPVPDKTKKFGVRWEVTTSKLSNRQDKQTHTFDAVLVCSGQYSVPRMPAIPGLQTFDGHVVHSHDYRVPDVFKGKMVAVVGAKSSGQDICLEVATVAEKVYLCHDLPKMTSYFPSNVDQKPGITQCQGRMIEFRGGEIVELDAIIFCTGYLHRFPFVDESVGLKVDDGRVTSLYKHFLSTSFPSLGIIGINQYTAFFPLFYMQVKYFRSIFTGRGTLFSQKSMKEDEEYEYNRKRRTGQPHRYAHHLLGNTQFSFYDSLADLAGVPRLPRVLQTVFNTAVHYRLKDVTTYRDYNFVVVDDNTLEIVEPK